MLIFLIEDDEALAEGISFMLEKKGMRQNGFLPAATAAGS